MLQADEIHELVKNKNLAQIKKRVQENPKIIDSIDEKGRAAPFTKMESIRRSKKYPMYFILITPEAAPMSLLTGAT